MVTSASAPAGLPLGFCAACGRDVIFHLEYEPDGTERFACVHCDRPLDGELRPTSEAELGEHGYGLIEPGGCGSGCAAGGCARRGVSAG